MPHFIVGISENLFQLKSPQEIMKAIYDTAESTNLFDKSDNGGIKVRINPLNPYHALAFGCKP